MHPLAFDAFFPGQAVGIFAPLFLVLFICIVVLKGYALWYSARASQKWWFIAILVLNTLGILPIVYLIFFRPKPNDSEKSHTTDSPDASSAT